MPSRNRIWGPVWFAIVALLAGCASVPEVPIASAPEELRGREITLAVRDKPSFAAMTADKMAAGALFGAIGGATAGSAMESAGNDLVAEYNVDDPAESIVHALGNGLQTRFSTTLAPGRARLTRAEAVEAVGVADLVLDVRTLLWGFAYFPTSWAKYRVLYVAHARLIDGKKGTVLAEGGCAFPPSQDADAAPGYDELLADGGKRLKQELKTAADFCANEFASKIFYVKFEPVGQGNVAAKPAGETIQPVKLDDLRDLMGK